MAGPRVKVGVGKIKPRGGDGGATDGVADRRARLCLEGRQEIRRAGRVGVRVACE